MLTQGFTQQEYEIMMSKSHLMAIHFTNNKIWVGLIYETDVKSIIFKPLLLDFYLGEDKKYHITFDFVSVATKDEIFIINNNNILFCTTLNPLIKEKYSQYYRVDEKLDDFDDYEEINKDKVVKINKKLH